MSVTIAWLTSALLAATVSSAEPPVELEWQAPAACPDRAWALARLASDARLTQAMRAAHVVVNINQQDDAFVAELTTAQGEAVGTRSLEAATCEELADAVIVVLAMALVPRPDEPETAAESFTRPSPPSEKPRAASTSAQASESPSESEAPSDAESAESDSGPFVRAGVALDHGSLPRSSFGIGLAGGYRFGAASLELRGAYLLPRAAAAEDPDNVAEGADVGGEFSRGDVLVAGCWASASWGRLALEGCLGAGLGVLRAEGYGLPAPATETLLFGVVTAELAVPLQLSERAGLRLGVGSWLPLTRETYAIEGLGPVFIPEPYGIRAEIASEMRF